MQAVGVVGYFAGGTGYFAGVAEGCGGAVQGGGSFDQAFEYSFDCETSKAYLLKDSVLPDGPTALSHPTNEDLFVGAPIRRSLRDACTFSRLVIGFGPPVGRVGVRFCESK